MRPQLIAKLLTYLCVLGFGLSFAACCTAYSIPPNQLTAHDYDMARRMGEGAVRTFGGAPSGSEEAYIRMYDLELESRQWERRDKIQDWAGKAGFVFFLALIWLVSIRASLYEDKT
jgi:hypothetical protein